MSIRVPLGTYTGPHPQRFYEYDDGDRCYLCGKFLSGPAIVYWFGPHDLSLHVDCALDLIVALGRDVSEIKRSHGLRPAMKPTEQP
jgi:hypothetical protein